jgi:Ca-activated chloride channel homolog
MSMANGNSGSNGNGNKGAGIAVTLESRPERRLIRPTGSLRHIDFCVRVGEFAESVRPDRTPLTLSLVLDRSGSMSGEKLATAKQAAAAVLDRMDARDRISLVVFDDRIDVVQPAAPATPEIKRRVRAELARIEARANTALHEGWLIGCKAIAADETEPRDRGVARCFLLTDGQANAGITDPEQIAGEAAGVLEHAGIGTSTFGIGDDYNESLLGPMAVAGGGQFHHLRTAGEITNTFVGELGELLSVAAGQVRLELDGGRDITTEVISEYWASQPNPGVSRTSVVVGDLPAAEERHIVVRFGFPPHQELAERTVLARVVWLAGGEEHSTPWQEVGFTYADNRSCDAERREHMNPAAMHWVGLHHAERARREATQLSRRGDVHGARSLVEKVAKRIAEYAGNDPELHAAIQELRALSQELLERPMDAAEAKERYFQSQRRSRGQKDFRTI